MSNKNNSKNDAHNLTPWEEYQQKQHQSGSSFFFHEKKIIKPHQFHSHPWSDRVWFFTILVILGAILLTSSYLSAPISKINAVKIQGSKELKISSIASNFKLEKGRSMLDVYGHTNKLAQRIKAKNPQLSQAKIKITNVNHLTIFIKKYATAGYLQTDQGYYAILGNGFVSNKIVDSRSANLPIIKKFNNRNKLKAMLNQYKLLPASIQSMISTISFSPTEVNPQRVFLEMKNRNQVYASISTFTSKMQYYPAISSKSKQPQVINFELGAYSYPLSQQPSQQKQSNVKNKQSTKLKQNHKLHD